jgi:putative membrane protein
MKPIALLAFAAGLAAIGALVLRGDANQIVQLLADAGPGFALVVLLHVPQTLASTLGWRALFDSQSRPSLGALYAIRWIRESANTLLPTAQIGGDVLRARLARKGGATMRSAASTTAVDVSLEVIAQAMFTALGLACLMGGPHSRAAAPLGVAAAMLVAGAGAALLIAQRFGLFLWVEACLARLTTVSQGASLSGLNAAVQQLYRQPSKLWRSALLHLAAWLLGVAETYVALNLLGMTPTWREAMVIESLGQAARGLGFFVPGALGVQEAAYLIICAMFGASPAQALALSLMRRARELALGLPGLVFWQWIETHRSLKKVTP